MDDVLVADHAEQAQARPAPRLVGAQHVSLAPLLEVDSGQLEAVLAGCDRLQSLAGGRPSGHVRDQQADARGCAAPDPPAQLVQLRDAEPVRVHHHHHRSRWERPRRPRPRWWRRGRRPRRQRIDASPRPWRRGPCGRAAPRHTARQAAPGPASVPRPERPVADAGHRRRRPEPRSPSDSAPSPIRGQTT